MPLTINNVANFTVRGASDIAYPGSGTLVYVATSGFGSRINSVNWITSAVVPSADGGDAIHIIWDGTRFWVDQDATSGDTRVYLFDASLNLLSNVNTTQASPSYLAGDGTFVYSANPNNNSVNKMTAVGLVANLPSFGGPPAQTSGPIVTALGNEWFINSNDPSGSCQFANLSGVVAALPLLLQAPVGMIFDGTNFWYTDTNNSALVKISPAGVILNTVALGAIPFGLGFDGTYLWTGSIVPSSLQVVDLAGTIQANVDTSFISTGTPIFVSGNIAGFTFVSFQHGATSVVSQFQIAAPIPPVTGGIVGTFVGVGSKGKVFGGTK